MPNNIYLKLNWVCTLYLLMSFVACKEVVYINFQSGFSLLNCSVHFTSGRKVIKLEYNLRLKIKCNDWLLADTCPQLANH